MYCIITEDVNGVNGGNRSIMYDDNDDSVMTPDDDTIKHRIDSR